METKKYVSPTWISLIGVPSFFIFLVGFFLAIWWKEFRWEIFFTSVYFFIITVALIKYDIKEEKKFVEEQQGESK